MSFPTSKKKNEINQPEADSFLIPIVDVPKNNR